jgi:multidrug resistance efflux pump
MSMAKSGPVLLPAPPPVAPVRRFHPWRLGDLLGRHAALLLAAGCGVGAWALLGGLAAGTHGMARGYVEDVPLAVSPPRAGRLAELRVDLGTPVKRGEVVARLDTTELEALKVKLLAERDVAVAKVGAAGDEQDTALLRSEVWRLRTVAESKQDDAELRALERELQRMESLYDRQLVKASDIEPLRRRRDALTARVATFESAASGGRAGLGWKAEQPDRHASSLKKRLLPLREELRVAEAALAETEVQIAGALLRAPADGVVAAIGRRPGEIAAAGEAVVTITTGRPGVVIAFLPEQRADVKVGARVSVAGLRVADRGRQGRVIEIAPDIAEVPVRFRASPTIPVWARRAAVALDGAPDGRWLPGQEVRVRF